MSTPYDYEARTGVRPVSWDDFYGLCKGLALAIANYKPEVIVGIARGGLYPATQLSHMLQTELIAIRLSRRVNDQVVHDDPVWIERPTNYVKGKRIVVVDEICDTGKTLQIVKQEIEQIGVSEIRTVTLYAHKQSAELVDYVGIITDELLLNPWDREIIVDGQFAFHPEYLGALQSQSDIQTSGYRLAIAPTKPDRIKHNSY